MLRDNSVPRKLCYDVTIGFHLEIAVQLAFKYSKLEVHRVVQPELQMKFSAQALGKAFFHVYQTDVQTKGAKIQLKYQVPLNFWRNHDRSVSFLSLL